MSEYYDTCVFVDYWKGDPDAVALINTAKTTPMTVNYSSITAMELWQNPNLGRKQEIEYTALTQFFLKEDPLTTNAAKIAGQWLRTLSRSARSTLAADALISASASIIGATIRTRNCKDLLKFYPNILTY